MREIIRWAKGNSRTFCGGFPRSRDGHKSSAHRRHSIALQFAGFCLGSSERAPFFFLAHSTKAGPCSNLSRSYEPVLWLYRNQGIVFTRRLSCPNRHLLRPRGVNRLFFYRLHSHWSKATNNAAIFSPCHCNGPCRDRCDPVSLWRKLHAYSFFAAA